MNRTTKETGTYHIEKCLTNCYHLELPYKYSFIVPNRSEASFELWHVCNVTNVPKLSALFFPYGENYKWLSSINGKTISGKQGVLISIQRPHDKNHYLPRFQGHKGDDSN